MNDLPCWLNSDDKEVAAALLELDWIWLEGEESESWNEQIWERKICKYRGWQFWSVPGEVCLMVSRNGAVFGLCLEAMNPKPDFEGEIKKAKNAISRVLKLQESAKPKQLTLFLLGLLLLCSCTQAKPKATAHHWCESSPNPAECFANQGAISAPCTAKRDNEFQKCWDEIRREDAVRESSKAD